MANLYIGLGGTGIKTLAALKEKTASYQHVDEEIAENDSVIIKNEFLGIDTEPFEFDTVLGISELDSFVFNNPINKDELLNGVSPDFARFYEWIDDIVLNNFDEKTAKMHAMRMFGRASLFNIRFDFLKLIDKKINSLLSLPSSKTGSNVHSITIITSTCGGTGSGMLLDVLFYIWCSMSRMGLESDRIAIMVYSVMPEVFLRNLPYNNITRKKLMLNTYGYLNELSAVIKDSSLRPINTVFHKFSAWVTNNVSEHFNPCRSAWLINGITDDGRIIEWENFHKTLADLIFFIGLTKEAFNNHCSCDVEEDNNPPVFSSAAYLSLSKPSSLLEKYIHDRFFYESIQQLIGKDNEAVDEWSVINSFGSEFIEPLFSRYEWFIKPYIEQMEMQVIASQNPELLMERYSNIRTTNDIENLSNDFEIVKFINELTEDLKKSIYEKCVDVCMNQNLQFALNYFSILDNYFTIKTINEVFQSQIDIQNIRKGFLIKKNDKDRIHDFFNDFSRFLKLDFQNIIYKKLSWEDEGFLDDCKIHIKNTISGFQSEISADWDREIKRAIVKESHNPFKVYLPAINDLIDESGNWIDGNSFDQLYKMIGIKFHVQDMLNFLHEKYPIFHPVKFEEIEVDIDLSEEINNFIKNNYDVKNIFGQSLLFYFDNLTLSAQTELKNKFERFNDLFLPVYFDGGQRGRLELGSDILATRLFNQLSHIPLLKDEIVVLIFQHNISLDYIIGFKYIEEEGDKNREERSRHLENYDNIHSEYFQPFIHKAFGSGKIWDVFEKNR